MSTRHFHKPYFFIFSSYFLLLFFYLLYINLHYLQGIPHVPDSVAYLFMAKMFASGHIILPIPANPDHFRFFDGTLNVQGGKWLFQYPFGHPLLLTIGVLIGMPSLIPPLIATLTIGALCLLITQLYSKKTLAFLLPLPFISPFFIENSASFMSHTSAAFYLTSAIVAIIFAFKKKNMYFFFLSGICIGLLFNTRPLTALPFLLFITVLIILKRKECNMWRFGMLAYFVGFGLLFLLWMFYNFSTTGSPLVSQYFEVNKGIFGFGQNESLAVFMTQRINNTLILTKNFFPMLYNLPVGITLGMLSGFLFFKRKTFWDSCFFISLFLLPFTYFFYNGTFLMYGPRFWYEMVPFVFLITARTLELLYDKFGKSIVVLLIIFVFSSLLRFYSFTPVTNPDFFSPLKVNDLLGFNFIDNRISTLVHKHGIHNAVVFVEDCHGNWWCYGSVFSENNPLLTSDIIYVKDLGEENKKIKTKFPTRKYYTVNYDTKAIRGIK